MPVWLSTLLLLLAVAPPARGAEVPPGQPSLTPEAPRQAGAVLPRAADYHTITPPAGNPAITLTLTPLDDKGDVDLYCSKGSQQPSPDSADFLSESIGVNQDVIYIPPLDPEEAEKGSPVYTCAVYNSGITNASVTYVLTVRFAAAATAGLNAEEREVARELFQRCCNTDSACRQWKLANDRAIADAKENGTLPTNSSTVLLETDLCSLGGVCIDGHLTQLNARGWYMACELPGDLFARFTQLRALQLAWNDFAGDIQEAARNLSALTLEELGLHGNKMRGQLGGDVCAMVQKGTLEMLQLGGNEIDGPLPACLFNDKSSLYVVGATLAGLAGPIPDAFPPASNLQILDLTGNNLTGSIPASLAALPKLIRFTASNNSLSGSLPPSWASPALSVIMLQYNNLSGPVPADLSNHSLMALGLEGNPGLTVGTAAGGSSSGGLSAGAVAGICLGVLVALALAAGAAFFLVQRRRQRRGARTAASNVKFEAFLDETEGPQQPRFSPSPATFYQASPGSMRDHTTSVELSKV